MDGLNPQIPLSATQQPDFAQKMGETYQLAGAIEKQQEIHQQRQDQQVIQQYLKEGGNFATPEGLAMAAEKLKDKVSPGGYQTLVQAQQEMEQQAANLEMAYAKMQPEVLQSHLQQQDYIARQLEGTISAYDQARIEKGDQAALDEFNKAKQQIIQGAAQQQMPGGRPLIDPKMLQRFQSMNPQEVQSALQSTNYYRDKLKTGLDLQQQQARLELTKQETKTSKALEEQRRRKPAGILPDEITESGLSGEEFLSMLPPGTAKQVKAVAEGRIPLESISSRGGARDRITQLVNQYDPEFSAIATKTKAAVEKDFTSGVASRNIASINTAIGHLGTLNKLGLALKNKDNQTLNRITNAIATEFGNPDITNYQLAQTALGEELMRTFRGVGASVTEAEQWKSQLGAARTPQQMLQVVKTASDLLESRISAMDSAYKRGTKSEKGFRDILDPKSVNTLSAITGKDYWDMYNLSGKGRATSAAKSEKESAPAGGDILSILKKHGVK